MILKKSCKNYLKIDESTTDQERLLYNVPPLDSLLSKYKMKSLL